MPTPPAATHPSPNACPSIALVIPTLREAGSLPALLTRITAALNASCPDHEILVVDDDSRDGTAELVAAISQKDPRVRLLVRKGERGLSGAILHGWQQTCAPILGVMDADLQHPPELLPALIAAIENGSDIAIASRYAPGCPMSPDVGDMGHHYRANEAVWNPLRKLASVTAIALTNPLQRPSIRVADPMSGFFLVRRRCVQNVLFQPTGFKLLLEILVRGPIAKVSEIPFAFGRRTAGRSKANLKVAADYLRLLIRLYTGRTSHPPTLTQESSGD